ncbi:MAG: glycosyltransferase family 92 protein [Treponema sp.]|jgi:hypothetical protein|nr:glycosyltransferase family 92 protein [Treponema sp.]
MLKKLTNHRAVSKILLVLKKIVERVEKAVKSPLSFLIMKIMKKINRCFICFLREVREYGYFTNELSIATIVRNEAPYLKEWIEYHKLVGVERFYIYDNYSTVYIYDNYSTDSIKEVLQPYIDSGEVVYTVFPAEEAHSRETQMSAFNDAVTRYKHKTRWLALIDADEFIVPLCADTITGVIKEIEKNIVHKKIAALCVFWVLYGFSGHYRRPDGGGGGLIIEQYTRSRVKALTKAAREAHKNYWWIEREWVKSIVNPRMVTVYYIHGGGYRDGYYGVDEKGNRIHEGGVVPEGLEASIEKIRINHYWTKSYEEFIEKIQRTKAHSTEKHTVIEYEAGFLSHKEDNVMEKYIQPLKEAMKSGRRT